MGNTVGFGELSFFDSVERTSSSNSLPFKMPIKLTRNIKELIHIAIVTLATIFVALWGLKSFVENSEVTFFQEGISFSPCLFFCHFQIILDLSQLTLPTTSWQSQQVSVPAKTKTNDNKITDLKSPKNMIKFLHSIKNDLLLTGKIRDEYISIENIVVKEQFKDYSKTTKLLTAKNPAFWPQNWQTTSNSVFSFISQRDNIKYLTDKKTEFLYQFFPSEIRN